MQIKVKYLMTILLLFLMVIGIAKTSNAALPGALDGDASIGVAGEHGESQAGGTAEAADHQGGYPGNFEMEYLLYGRIKWKDQVVDINRVTYSTSKTMRLSSFLAYSAIDELESAGRIYDKDLAKEVIWKRLEEDTGIPATAWGSGEIILLSQGLHASINIRFKTRNRNNSCFGDFRGSDVIPSNFHPTYVISDGVVNFETTYSSGTVNHNGDINASMGKSFANKEGYKMMGPGWVSIIRNKHNIVDFTQNMFLGALTNVQFYDQLDNNSAEYTLCAALELPLDPTKIPEYKNIPNTTFLGWYSMPPDLTKPTMAEALAGATMYIAPNGDIVKPIDVPMRLYACRQVTVSLYSFSDLAAAGKGEEGYTLIPGGLMILPYGKTLAVTDPAPPAPTYTFGGWFDKPLGLGILYDNNTAIFADTLLYAFWVSDPVTIEYYVKSSLTSGYSLFSTKKISRFSKLTASYRISAPAIKVTEGNVIKTYSLAGWWFNSDLSGSDAFSGDNANFVVTDDVTKLYAGYQAGADLSKLMMHIVWNFEECDWTNDPYEITSTLIIPEQYRSAGSLYLENCDCHGVCTKHSCTYAPECERKTCRGHQGGLTDTAHKHNAGCHSTSLAGTVLICKKEEHTHKAWPSSCWTTRRCTQTYETSACESSQGPHELTCKTPFVHCGAKAICRYGSHNTSTKRECSYKTPIKLVWYLAPTITAVGRCRGNIGISYADNNKKITYKIGKDSTLGTESYTSSKPRQTVTKATYLAYSSYNIIANNTEPNYKSKIDMPVHRDGWGQNWYLTEDGRTDLVESIKGPYRFDGTAPEVEITAQTSGERYQENAWVNKDVKVSINIVEELSGINDDTSYIAVTGKYLKDVNNVVSVSERYSLNGSGGEFDFSGGGSDAHNRKVSLNLTKSGEYVIRVHIEDNANLGCTSAEDGIPNIFEQEFSVNIDKIPPIIKYGYVNVPKPYAINNTVQNRYETSSEREPAFYLHVSDNESNYPSSGLEIYNRKVTDKKILGLALADSNEEGISGGTADHAFGEYEELKISKEFLMKGKDVYLLVYARDRAGNTSYTTQRLAVPGDFVIGTINDQQGSVGSKDSWQIADIYTRELPLPQLFINRSLLEFTDINNVETVTGPLEITKVYDVKWENNIRWNNTAKSKMFAVYRNKINDMIGLGYRVNFRYGLIGYGIDPNDTTELQFELYGKVQDQYCKLNLYLPDENAQPQYVPEASEYYIRTFKNVNRVDNFNENDENAMAVNSAQWVKIDKDTSYLYFNYSIPATATFTYTSRDGAAYQEYPYSGTEVLVKINLYSLKHMDQDNKYIPYNLITDPYVPWTSAEVVNSELLSQHFYGTSKTVQKLYRTFGVAQATANGQAFWYDADMTALDDITGGRGQ